MVVVMIYGNVAPQKYFCSSSLSDNGNSLSVMHSLSRYSVGHQKAIEGGWVDTSLFCDITVHEGSRWFMIFSVSYFLAGD